SHRKASWPGKADTVEAGPRRGGCPNPPRRAKPGRVWLVHGPKLPLLRASQKAWRALLARPDEGVRAYVGSGGWTVFPGDIDSGFVENPGCSLFRLDQHGGRDSGVVIDRDKHLWPLVRIGFRPRRERK